MVISKQDKWTGEPLEVDPQHVQANAPVLHEMLEEAHRSGYASTQDQSDREEALAYLQELSSTNENSFLILYRGDVFFQRIATA